MFSLSRWRNREMWHALSKITQLLRGGPRVKWQKERQRYRWMGLSRWLSDKESARQAVDTGSIPGSGRCPGEGNGNPLQYPCLGNPMDVLLLFSWCKAASWWGSHVKVGLRLPWHMMLFFPRTVLFLQLQHIIPLTPPWLKYCDYHSAEHQKENWNVQNYPSSVLSL